MTTSSKAPPAEAFPRPLGATRPDFQSPAAPRLRPHSAYKAEFVERILALQPDSVLDVGAGDGALLATLRAAGVGRCVGLEVDDASVQRLRGQDLEASSGVGEALPFGNAAVDVVVLQYAAHHLHDLGRGLAEAARVARRAVLVLDPWYDQSLPCQRAALAYDLWCKDIDRRLGLVHNPCPSVGELAAPFLARGGFRIEATHRLILQSMDPDAVIVEAASHLTRLGDAEPVLERGLAEIVGRVRRDGISDDGAVLFAAMAT